MVEIKEKKTKNIIKDGDSTAQLLAIRAYTNHSVLAVWASEHQHAIKVNNL